MACLPLGSFWPKPVTPPDRETDPVKPQIRRAQPHHLHEIMAIDAACFPERMRQARKDAAEFVRDQSRRAAYIAWDGTEAVGFVGCSTLALRSLDIERVAVLPDWRDAGVGRLLVNSVIAGQRPEVARTIVPELLEDGWRFFAAIGFRGVTVWQDYCASVDGNGSQDGWVMKRPCAG